MKNLLTILIFLLVISCGTKKNTIISRNYQALTTKYNVLFNGKEAYKKGMKKIEGKHSDNFWKRLPIESITFDEDKVNVPKFDNFDGGFNAKSAKTRTSSTPFDRAEEKAVKAIQKHSMNFGGYEKNSQIDDAYLLLGKSRYYTQRFIPAIEAFNYIISNYPDANLNYQAHVWKAKSNIRLGNEDVAITSMKTLLSTEDEEKKIRIPSSIKEEVYTTLAMAYTQSDSISKVVENLKKAIKTFHNKEQTSRNFYVLGQIYDELGYKDSARVVFNKIANSKKFPRKYRIHATIESVKNTESDSSDVAMTKRFKKLIRNADNRKYYDILYYQLGNLYEKEGNSKKAIESYTKSLNAKGTPYQKTYTFEKLGNLYFQQENYPMAGSYYDSVLQVVSKANQKEKRIRRIKRKNKALVSLNKYENIVKHNDSVLKIVLMSDAERTSFFNNYIEKIKEEDELRRQQLANSQNLGNSFEGSIGNNKTKKWYFYNLQVKQFGKSEFERTWGNRKLEDNWRWSDRTIANTTGESTADDEDSEIKSRYKVETYLEAIPKDAKTINTLKEERNNGLYQLGLSYKEQFKNANLAIKNLERLQPINTDKELDLPIHYHLYQLYTSKDDVTKANQAKNVILTKYPSSKFAEIIKSPTKKITTALKKDVVATKYKEVYQLYKNGNYQMVVAQIDSYLKTIDKSDLIPKFVLLKAMALGKYESKENYKKELEFVKINYPNTIQSKKAEEIINLLNK